MKILKEANLKFKELRLRNINTLIEIIGSRDRKFLSSHSDDYDTTKPIVFNLFFFEDSKLYLQDKYTKSQILMDNKKHRHNHGFSSGGTMWGLCCDFADFILTGNYTHGLHGYGGLYCPHWGYTDDAMRTIRTMAMEIGFIDGIEEKDHELMRRIDIGETFKLSSLTGENS